MSDREYRQLLARWLVAAFVVLADSSAYPSEAYRRQFGELWKMMRAMDIYGQNELRDVAEGRA